MKRTAHKSVYVRVDSWGHKTYYLRIYHNGKQTWRAAGGRLDDALRIQAELKAQRTYARFGLMRPETITFEKLAHEYLEYYRSSGSKENQKRVRSLMNHLIEYFGPMELQEITPWSIEGYTRLRVDKRMAPRTVNTELDYLRASLGKAVEWGFLLNVPVVKRIPVHEAGPARDLSPDEIIRILSDLPEHQRDATVIALGTGMRIGEIYRLTPDQWDKDAHVVTILKTKAKREREIPIAPHIEQIFERRFKRYTTKLFPYSSVENMVAHFVYERKQLYRKLGKWRFHDLRHTFASMLAERGAPAHVIMELLGHSSLDMTTRYTHTDRERKRAAVSLLTTNGPTRHKK